MKFYARIEQILQDKMVVFKALSNNKTGVKPFKWTYAILPIIASIICIILVIVYYGQLPESIAIQFNSNGDPAKYSSPFSAAVICIGATVLVAMLSAWSACFIATREFLTDDERVLVKPHLLIPIIGNIPTVLSIVVIYIYWDICVYNTSGDHFISMWIFALIVIAISFVILAIFLAPPLIKSIGKDIYGVKKINAEEDATKVVQEQQTLQASKETNINKAANDNQKD